MIKPTRQNVLSNTNNMMDGNWVRTGARLTTSSDYPPYAAGGNVYYLKGDGSLNAHQVYRMFNSQLSSTRTISVLSPAAHGSVGSDLDQHRVHCLSKFQPLERNSWHSRWGRLVFGHHPGSQRMVPVRVDLLYFRREIFHRLHRRGLRLSPGRIQVPNGRHIHFLATGGDRLPGNELDRRRDHSSG